MFDHEGMKQAPSLAVPSSVLPRRACHGPSGVGAALRADACCLADLHQGAIAAQAIRRAERRSVARPRTTTRRHIDEDIVACKLEIKSGCIPGNGHEPRPFHCIEAVHMNKTSGHPRDREGTILSAEPMEDGPV